MTSQINPNNIDGTYPVAGVPNNTQGMRDNFTNTRTNFQYAADEITELQSKAVLKAAITGTTLDNNMNDQEIYAVQLRDVSYAYSALTATAGSIVIDYSVAPFQQINLSGPISLSFTNWPTAGTAGTVRVGFNITNVSQTVTLPAAVTQGVSTIGGISPGTPGVSNTITFSATGNYAFEFATIDGGTNIWVFDDSRAPGIIPAPLAITNTTASTSDATGALTVAGGVGIGGNLNVGGNLVTYTSSGNIAFQALDNGTVQIDIPTVAANTGGGVNIVGSSTGAYQNIVNAGGMLHITGNDNTSARAIIDTFSSNASSGYSGLILRRGRGSAGTPSAVQSGDVVARIGATAYGNVGFITLSGNSAASIDFVATENQTTANAGSKIEFYSTTAGTATRTLSLTLNGNVSTFPGNVTVGGAGGVALTDGGTVGYGVGAGGTVAQGGNKSTGVTLSKPSGEITMANTNLAADTSVSFTLTNTTISNRDVMMLNIVGGVATAGCYNLDAVCNSGSAVITVRNITAGTLGEAIVLRYVVIKGSIT